MERSKHTKIIPLLRISRKLEIRYNPGQKYKKTSTGSFRTDGPRGTVPFAIQRLICFLYWILILHQPQFLARYSPQDTANRSYFYHFTFLYVYGFSSHLTHFVLKFEIFYFFVSLWCFSFEKASLL